MKDPLKKYIQEHREEFDTHEASSEVFDKIMSKIENSAPSVEETRSMFSWKNFAIAASITLVLSLGIFDLWQKKEIDKSVFATKETPKKENEDSNNISVAQKESETFKIETKTKKNTANVLVHSSSDYSKKPIINQSHITNYITEGEIHPDKANAIELIDNQFSASSRLQGIALVKNLPDYDAKIVDLLSEKAISDENTNVRLAAVSALEKQRLNPIITDKIQQIFVQQNDPMVQKELICFFAEHQSSELSAEVNTKLLALAQDPTTVAFVKDEAYAVLMKY